jgi:hypothetical protein
MIGMCACLVADVGEEGEVEVVLIVEALLLGNVIAADPQDDAIQLVELPWYENNKQDPACYLTPCAAAQEAAIVLTSQQKR